MDDNNRYGVLETQKYLIPILIDLDKLCREHDIRYAISFGTLIGAVRHGGFVPWDDDIDISFDRENYGKFLKIATEYLPEEYMIVEDMWVKRISRKDNPGVKKFPPERCIDLFVFDNVPDSNSLLKKKLFRLKMLQGMLKTRIIYKNYAPVYKVLLCGTHVMGKFIPRKTKQKQYDEICQWGNDTITKYINCFNAEFSYISTQRHDSDLFDEYADIEFEGHKFMTVAKWDKFLRTDYGDYMQLPPEEDRVPKHQEI